MKKKKKKKGITIIGIGSNLRGHMGSPRDNLKIVLNYLSRNGLRVEKCSKIYSSRPYPSGKGPIFFNRVVIVKTNMYAIEILKCLKKIESIFGRTGEETPIGEYEIKNKAYKPTWYKKETLNGKTRVRAIPFGHKDHEIGHWWMGMKRLGDPVPGSYGIHGVNAGKVNEFVKKNFDWRNGSAGCPNIQEWYLHFLAKMVPLGTRVNIVQKDKWVKKRDFIPPSSATL